MSTFFDHSRRTLIEQGVGALPSALSKAVWGLKLIKYMASGETEDLSKKYQEQLLGLLKLCKTLHADGLQKD